MTVITPNIYTAGRQSNKDNKQKSPSFGNAGLFSRGVEYLHSNPVGGVVLTDTFGMIIPRTAIDYYEQNPVYGMETFRDEAVPMVFNPFGPTLVGGAISMLGANELKGVYAGRDAVKLLGEAWKSSGNNTEKYFRTLFEGKLKGQDLNEFAKRAASLADNPPADKKDLKKARKEFLEDFTMKTGVSESLEFDIKGNKLETSIGRFMDDSIALAQKFTGKNADEIDGLMTRMSDTAVRKTLWGAGISAAGMFTWPFVNKAITKWQTGKDGYPAPKDFEDENAPQLQKTEEEKEQDKKKLWGMKLLSAAGMVGIMGASIAIGSKDGAKTLINPKSFLKVIELKGRMPSLNLIKFMYGSFLTGRILSSRAETEVENRTLRDYSGFINWLVMGPIVAMGIMHAFDKTLLHKPPEGKGFLSRAIPSFSEVRARVAKMTDAKAIKRLQRVHIGGIVGGLAYSIAALGISIPLLNNKNTNEDRERELRAIALQQGKHMEDDPSTSFISFMKNHGPAILNNNRNDFLQALALKTDGYNGN